jgi:hypothetical protein
MLGLYPAGTSALSDAPLVYAVAGDAAWSADSSTPGVSAAEYATSLDLAGQAASLYDSDDGSGYDATTSSGVLADDAASSSVTWSLAAAASAADDAAARDNASADFLEPASFPAFAGEPLGVAAATPALGPQPGAGGALVTPAGVFLCGGQPESTGPPLTQPAAAAGAQDLGGPDLPAGPPPEFGRQDV